VGSDYSTGPMHGWPVFRRVDRPILNIVIGLKTGEYR